MNSIIESLNCRCDILACQLEIAPTRTKQERSQHVDSVIDKISTTLQHRLADLVVLPELSTIDYLREAFDRPTDWTITVTCLSRKSRNRRTYQG